MKHFNGERYLRIGDGLYITTRRSGNSDQPSTQPASGNRNSHPTSSLGPSRTPDPRSFSTVSSPYTPFWTLSPEQYRMKYYQQEEARKRQEEQERKRREVAAINAALDKAASAQYQVMEKLYLEGS